MQMYRTAAGAALVLLAAAGIASAGVSHDEAAKLKGQLTPLGAERAGNKDGTIPEWKPVAAGPARTDKLPADLFPNEKPLFQITAKNAAQYGDKLSEGTVALLNKFPTYRLDVYPTHRTASAPQYVYDNTFNNAVNGTMSAEGPSGVYGGVPFPIPKNGLEAIWNHILKPHCAATDTVFRNLVGTADGRQALANRAEQTMAFPYYFAESNEAEWKKGGSYYQQLRFIATDPPFKAGESIVINDSVNGSRQAWQYLVGQRRVRRAPTVGYDTPDFVSSGTNYFDEVIGFYGAPDRYDWKLVGKREVFIPYNTNRFHLTDAEKAFMPFHANPDHLRWELHRVWVVEATLQSGKRHAVPKRRFYLDEDTWSVALVDGFDAEDKLWRSSQILPFLMPEVPMVNGDATLVYSLQNSTYSAILSMNGGHYHCTAAKPASYFSGDALIEDNAR